MTMFRWTRGILSRRFLPNFTASTLVTWTVALGSASPCAAQERPPRDRGRPEDAAQGERPLTPEEVAFHDGVATVPDRDTFKKLSFQGKVRMDQYLNDLEHVKFQIENAGTDRARLYFMNTKTHQGHPGFMQAIGLRRGRGGPRGGGPQDPGGGRQMRGALTYRPLVRSPGGEPGLYTFDFQPNDAFSVELLKFAQGMLLEKAPVLRGRLGYHPLERSRERYERDKGEFERAGIRVYLDKDLQLDLAYLPLNAARTFGRLRAMSLGELPTPRDVVLYNALPNELPRVAGIITSVRQTPLSHVNLRAVQDRVPNAFILGASENPAIKPLIGKYVRYEVAVDGFQIREATSAEVDAHFAELRPTASQVPKRDLAAIEIKRLDEIAFGDSAIFGMKTANVASMRRFGLPEGTVPDGFGVPFHFYDAFMKHNGLYEKATSILSSPEFEKDKGRQETELARLRQLVREGTFPDSLMAALTVLQKSFPEGTSIRCRSSTNNEDLPGFSGAGLYDSVTHGPTEGHLANSIKDVFASTWNFRAFEEREFYRIDHFATAMGVLVHVNFTGERANGVAVTEDVLYQTQGNYYLNSQVGEDMVTNPEGQSIPEEVLLGWWADDGHEVRQYSNRTEGEGRVLQTEDLNLLRKCLSRIHGRFAKLYGVDRDAPGFAMEIEYKITREGMLSIKQARPWVFAGKSTAAREARG
jgi:hypothetical protein